MKNTISKPQAVLLSSSGLGNMIPILELGNRLVTHLDFNVTVFVVASATSSVQSEIIKSAVNSDPKLSHVIEIPSPDISNLVSPTASMVTRQSVVMREIRPALRFAMSALESPPSILIVDIFGTESLILGDEFHIPKYVFIASNAMLVALTVFIPTLDKLVQGQYIHQKQPFSIPGCMSVRPDDVVDPMLDRNDQQYPEYVRIGAEIPLSDGILVNTWEDLQPRELKALRDDKLLGRVVKVPVHTIGPIVRPMTTRLGNKELFDWLDKQPSESVLYVSFGSGGTLSYEQMRELAWGLELSNQRFIWVVRHPTVISKAGSFFTVGNSSGDNFDISSYLPDGFLTRTRDVGVLIPEWANQSEILSHPSIGAFFTHCGWNSTLESIVNGVPMIAWPLYAEQRLNATMLTEELGIAVRSKIFPSNGVVDRKEINMMVRRIMVDEEGVKIKNKVKWLKLSAEKAWNTENGSSYLGLSFLAKEYQMRNNFEI